MDGDGISKDLDDAKKKQFRYWAFISHSHHDKRVAKWLMAALSRERVPSSKRDLISPSARYLDALFLDETGAGASDRLAAELEQALRASRHLIVLCSPFAVASPHVNDEILAFRRMGHGRVLCVVVAGVPNATDDAKPALECLPTAVRFRLGSDGMLSQSLPLGERPLATHLKEESETDKRQVIDQLVPPLLDLQRRDLERMRGRRRWLLGATFGVMLGLLAAAGAGAWYAFFAPVKHCYKQYVRRWGSWNGIDPVSDASSKHREKFYVFTTKGAWGRVEEVRYLNSTGACANDGMNSVLGNGLTSPCSAAVACRVRFKYRSDGSLEEERLESQYGTTLETLNYIDSAAAVFVEAQSVCNRSPSGVQRVAFERHESGAQAGLNRALHFFDAAHGPRLSSDGFQGIHYEYDDTGRVVRKSYLGFAGQPGVDRTSRCAGIEYKWDARGDLVQLTHLRADGSPCRSVSGVTAERYELDADGNTVRGAYLDGSGRPTSHITEKIAGWTWERDSRGFVIRTSYVDTGGHAAMHGDGYASFDAKRDAHGNRTDVTLFDMKGSVRTGVGAGYARRHAEFDPHGAMVFEAYFDEAGKRTLDKEGRASVRYRFDQQGNQLGWIGFGVDGMPTISRDGVASWLSQVDERGHRLRSDFFGLTGEIVVARTWAAGERYEYDDRGNRIAFTAVGLDGAPTLVRWGYSTERSTFDELGDEIQTTYWDEFGKRTFRDEDYSSSRRRYDEHGNAIERRFLGTDDREIVTAQECTFWKSRFDDHGHEIERALFGLNGEPFLHKHGYSSWRARRDENDREIERVYLGTKGEPVRVEAGFHISRQSRDDRGNVTEESFFDTHGDPVLRDGHYATVKQRWDERGNLFEKSYFGPKGEAILHSDGMAKERSTFDDRGHAVETAYFDAEGKPVRASQGCGLWRRRYDYDGDTLEERCFDEQGQPALGKDKSHLRIHRYDAQRDGEGHHLRLETRLFGKNDGPIEGDDGYSIVRSKYDARGNLVESTHFGIREEPILLKNDYHARRSVYDRRGKELERTFHGLGDGLAHSSVGRAIVRFEYDERGRMLRETSLGPHEEPVDCSDEHWSYRTWTYDERGKATERRFDKKARPVPIPATAKH